MRGHEALVLIDGLGLNQPAQPAASRTWRRLKLRPHPGGCVVRTKAQLPSSASNTAPRPELARRLPSSPFQAPNSLRRASPQPRSGPASRTVRSLGFPSPAQGLGGAASSAARSDPAPGSALAFARSLSSAWPGSRATSTVTSLGRLVPPAHTHANLGVLHARPRDAALPSRLDSNPLGGRKTTLIATDPCMQMLDPSRRRCSSSTSSSRGTSPTPEDGRLTPKTAHRTMCAARCRRRPRTEPTRRPRLRFPGRCSCGHQAPWD